MTSEEWFEVVRFPDGVTMIAEPGHHEDVKSYLVEGDRYVAVLDTGMGFAGFKAVVDSITSLEPIVLLSHAHWDHIGGAHQYSDVRVHPSEADGLRAGYPNAKMRATMEPQYLVNKLLPAGLDPETAMIPGCPPSTLLNDGDIIELGGRQLEVFHTPGHSPGGITLLDREHRLLFPGDAIYAGPMYAFAPSSDPAAYRESLRRIAELAEHADTIYPSHNAVPLRAADAIAMHQAYEEIWAGRAPDEQYDDRDVFDFGSFSFWLRPIGYGASS